MKFKSQFSDGAGFVSEAQAVPGWWRRGIRPEHREKNRHGLDHLGAVAKSFSTI